MEKTIDSSHEIGENVMITDRNQLLTITPEQAKKIKSLRIENQEFHDEFGSILLSLNELDSLCFYKCEDLNSWLFYFKRCKVLQFLDCGLTSKDATWCLSYILSWEHIEILDLTHNNIGIDPEPFLDWLKNHLWGEVSIDKIVLSDNKFREEDKNKILLAFEKWGFPQFVV